MARTRDTAVDGIVEQGPLDESPLMGLVFTRNCGVPVLSKSAAYTATGLDWLILVDATAAGVTITLPAADVSGTLTNNAGARYRIVKVDSGGNAVTVARAGSDTINGGTTVSTTTQYHGFDVYCTAAATWLAVGCG